MKDAKSAVRSDLVDPETQMLETEIIGLRVLLISIHHRRGHEFSVLVECVETNGERYVSLFKDVVLFVTALVFVLLIVWLCFHTLDSADSSPDAKRWAQSVLSAAAGGLIGYLIKKIAR